MNVIRLTRVGKKKDASFRVIVIDSKRKVQAGNYLEMVGSYDPRSNTSDLKADRIKHWMSEGAQPSDTVHNLLISQKVIEGKKINVYCDPMIEFGGEIVGGLRIRKPNGIPAAPAKAKADEFSDDIPF